MRLVDQITLGNSVADNSGKIKWINHPMSILEMFCYTDDAGVKPLKITIGLLSKMGFNGGTKCIGWFTFKWENDKLTIYQENSAIVISCEYIHHLQNLIFFLTWEKLTI